MHCVLGAGSPTPCNMFNASICAEQHTSLQIPKRVHAQQEFDMPRFEPDLIKRQCLLLKIVGTV